MSEQQGSVTVPMVGLRDVQVKATYSPTLDAILFYLAAPERSVSVHVSPEVARRLVQALLPAIDASMAARIRAAVAAAEHGS